MNKIILILLCFVCVLVNGNAQFLTSAPVEITSEVPDPNYPGLFDVNFTAGNLDCTGHFSADAGQYTVLISSSQSLPQTNCFFSTVDGGPSFNPSSLSGNYFFTKASTSTANLFLDTYNGVPQWYTYPVYWYTYTFSPVAPPSQEIATGTGVPITIQLQGNTNGADPCYPDSTIIANTPASGSLTDVYEGTNALVTYTPDDGFIGTDFFSFEEFFGNSLTPPATVTVDVEPLLANSQTQQTYINTPSVVEMSASPPSPLLSYVVVSGPTNGTLQQIQPNELIYTPNNNFLGTDSVSFYAEYGTSLSTTGAITFVVLPKLVTANDGYYSTLTNTPISITLDASGGLGPLKYTIDSTPQNGTLTGKPPNLTYQANAGFIGEDNIVFDVTDGNSDSYGQINISVVSQAGLQAQIPASEYSALLDLYNACGGPGWIDNEGWDDPNAPVWFGITVEGVQYDNYGNVVSQGNVASINLPSNNLQGNLQESIGNFSVLRDLDLSFNGLGGGIPDSTANLLNLLYLNLSDNNLAGNIPSTLSSMESLDTLNLAGNQFTGSIPQNLPLSLSSIQLQNNQLDGIFPVFPSGNSIIINITNNWIDIWNPSSISNIFQTVVDGGSVNFIPQGLGVDVSKSALQPGLQTFTNFLRQGYRFAIVAGWGGLTENPNAEVQLNQARNAGLLTAGYCRLNFASTYSGARQIRNALDAFGPEAAYLKFLAIDVEADMTNQLSPGLLEYLANSASQSIAVVAAQSDAVARIQQAAAQVSSVGLVPVIYTLKSYWFQITSNSTLFSQMGIPLWWSQDGPPITDLPDLSSSSRTFGGWTNDIGKQFAQNIYLNSLLADLDVFSSSAFALTNSAYSPINFHLDISLSGTQAKLSWSNPTLDLEEATSLNGSWTITPSAISPFTLSGKSTSNFFRLR